MNAYLSMMVIIGVISVADIAAAPRSPDNFLRMELFQRCWRSAGLCSMVLGDVLIYGGNVQIQKF
jgi:hypothetical protein